MNECIVINNSMEHKAEKSGDVRAAKLVDSRIGATPDMVPKCMDKDGSHSFGIALDQESQSHCSAFQKLMSPRAENTECEARYKNLSSRLSQHFM